MHNELLDYRPADQMRDEFRRARSFDRLGTPVSATDAKSLFLEGVKQVSRENLQDTVGRVVVFGAEFVEMAIERDAVYLSSPPIGSGNFWPEDAALMERMASIVLLEGPGSATRIWNVLKETLSDAVMTQVEEALELAIGASYSSPRAIATGQQAVEGFLFRARRLDERGKTAAALDLIYDSIDDLLRTPEIQDLDSILASLRVSDFSTDLLLGVLTATLPAKSRLPSRRELADRVEKVVKARGEWESGLLTGL